MSTDDRWDEIGRRVEQRYIGKYHGLVFDNKDPKRLGRLRLLVPEVLGAVPSGWALPCFPYGGGRNFGNFDVPPVTRGPDGSYTTSVWVEFYRGNPQYPIWVGCCPGAPGGEPDPPGDGDEDPPDIDTHVLRTFSGHSLVAVDRPGAERLDLRDASGQKISLVAPLRDGTKRDADGNPTKTAGEVGYGDLVTGEAKIEVTDFAGNTVLLDARRDAPTILLKNTDRDQRVVQTIELYGASDGARIVIRDNHENVVTLDRGGVRVEALGGTDRIEMNAAGVAADAPRVNINSGTMGAARRNDQVLSTMTDDPVFWNWIAMLMGWLASHTHMSGTGATTPPVMPFPGTTPSQCASKIVQASETVVIGD